MYISETSNSLIELRLLSEITLSNPIIVFYLLVEDPTLRFLHPKKKQKRERFYGVDSPLLRLVLRVSASIVFLFL